MQPLTTITPEYVHYCPEIMVYGKLYISRPYQTAIHLCACGCGQEIVTPLKENGWELTETDGKVSLSPSIGNQRLPCKTHYFIRDNQVIWL